MICAVFGRSELTWLVKATDAAGRIRLHVERLKMAGTAPLEKEDDGLRAGDALRVPRRLFGEDELGQRHAEHAQAPHAQNAAAGKETCRVEVRAGHWGRAAEVRAAERQENRIEYATESNGCEAWALSG
jgi:hypothetical protein